MKNVGLDSKLTKPDFNQEERSRVELFVFQVSNSSSMIWMQGMVEEIIYPLDCESDKTQEIQYCKGGGISNGVLFVRCDWSLYEIIYILVINPA